MGRAGAPLEPMRKTLQRIAAALAHLESAVLSMLIGGMIGVALLQIAVRKLHWLERAVGNLDWSSAVLNAALLWLAMVGALAATGARKHIQIDLGAHLFGERARHILAGVTQAFAAGVAGWLAEASARYVRQLAGGGGRAFFHVPDWAVFTIMPATLALMAVRFAVQAALAFGRLRAPRGAGGPAAGRAP